MFFECYTMVIPFLDTFDSITNKIALILPGNTSFFGHVHYCNCKTILSRCNCFKRLTSAGSVVSLIAGLFFGSVSAYGAFRISNDPQDYWTSLSKYKNTLEILGICQLWTFSFIAVSFYSSVCWHTGTCDGNEVQEIWKVNARRHHGRTEVKVFVKLFLLLMPYSCKTITWQCFLTYDDI